MNRQHPEGSTTSSSSSSGPSAPPAPQTTMECLSCHQLFRNSSELELHLQHNPDICGVIHMHEIEATQSSSTSTSSAGGCILT